MAKTLLLGLGGTGSRVVAHVVKELRKKKADINDGNLACAVLDTNTKDQGKLKKLGVNVPIIATSKDRKIGEYFTMYSHEGVMDWMPDTPTLREESMKDGASQMRPKSRLAFLDVISSTTISDLKDVINTLFDMNAREEKVRVLIVSSLAGGTGSGMFIQTAMWVRKYFDDHNTGVTIRGIFLLPDVFVGTLDDIENDLTEGASVYANAYGAIRELNTINKIKTKSNYKFPHRIRIGDLFDSDAGQPDGKPVYNYSFFIDSVAEKGAGLKELAQYEKLAARMVYMQLYAPMADDLYSEEDNLFKRFEMSEEPVFGSCGTAKAVYPFEDVLEYCALRAAKDVISSGWRRLDVEIEEKLRREEEKEAKGKLLNERIDPRAEFVALFDRYSKRDEAQSGSDRLFVTLYKHVMNEVRKRGENNKLVSEFFDKSTDFIKYVGEHMTSVVESRDPGDIGSIQVSADAVNEKNSVAALLKVVQQTKDGVDQYLENAELAFDRIAEDIADDICPLNMGDVNSTVDYSILGMFTKVDEENNRYFIHPVAMRYLLYRLLDELRADRENIDIEGELKKARATDGYDGISFDNPLTAEKERDPEAYLKSRNILQYEPMFIKPFKKKYIQYNSNQVTGCDAYVKAAVRDRVWLILIERIEKLIDVVEEFFDDLVKVVNTIGDKLDDNVTRNGSDADRIMYVCASEEAKEHIFKSTRFDPEESAEEVYEIIASTLYGAFCAKESPNAENNAPYAGKSVDVAFYKNVKRIYSEQLMSRSECKKAIDLDIYTAICRSSDAEFEKAEEERKKLEEESDRLNIDSETDEEIVADDKAVRYQDALEEVVSNLRYMSLPMIISSSEQTDDASESTDTAYEDELKRPIRKYKTFWGFSPILSKACPQLGTILGVNVEQQENIAYDKNVLECYRAVYGIEARYIPKFNEMNGGIYYTSYRDTVAYIEREVSSGNEGAYVQTPHLDKTWHAILPYITKEKQAEEERRFFRLLWLALAYGEIYLDPHEKFCIKRRKKDAYGEYDDDELLRYEGRTIGKVDIDLLISALQTDGVFKQCSERLEAKFKEECDFLETYEGTEFFKGKKIDASSKRTAKSGEEAPAEGKSAKAVKHVGGVAGTGATNALTVIVRYNSSIKASSDVVHALLKGLESLIGDMVKGNYRAGENGKIKHKTYELCKRIYDASEMKSADIPAIRHWKEAWSKPAEDE